ncbi:MAG: hypothetical protein WD065_06130 [Planctomycetaceae bacterium]
MNTNLFITGLREKLPIIAPVEQAADIAEVLPGASIDSRTEFAWWETWSEPVLAWGVTRLVCLFFLYAGWLYWPIPVDFRSQNPAAGPQQNLADYYRRWAAHPEEFAGSPMIGLELGGDDRWLAPLVRWDSFWYLSIAEVGYVHHPKPEANNTSAGQDHNNRREQNLVFFPAYPLMILALGGADIPHALAAVLIANVSTLLTSCLLYELVRRSYTASIARWTVWSWLLYPASFFGMTAYSDSTMALAVVGALWYVQRERYALAGLIAGVTSAMRPPGVLLGIALIDGWFHRRWLAATFGMLLSGVGLAAYFWYLGRTFGDPFLYFKTIQEWGNIQTGPSRWDPLGWYFKAYHSLKYSLSLIAEKKPLLYYHSWRVVDPWMFAWVLFFLPTVRKFSWGQILFTLAMVLLLITGASSLASIGRYCWVIMPVFVAAGWRLSESRIRWPMLAAMSFGLCWSAFLFGGNWEII